MEHSRKEGGGPQKGWIAAVSTRIVHKGDAGLVLEYQLISNENNKTTRKIIEKRCREQEEKRMGINAMGTQMMGAK